MCTLAITIKKLTTLAHFMYSACYLLLKTKEPDRYEILVCVPSWESNWDH